MTTSGVDTPRARSVQCTHDDLVVGLHDGRVISVPLAWFPRLLGASADERANTRLIGDGEGIRWPAIDEDLSVAGLLAGRPHTARSAA